MKTLIAAFSLLFAAAVYADANDTTINVLLDGSDRYADGTPVMKGERYALCWSAGEFAGLKADGTLVNPDDRIIEIAAIGKPGEWSAYLFQIPYADMAELSKGTFSLWMLDTRVFAADGGVSFSKQDGLELASVNGAVDTGKDVKLYPLGSGTIVGESEKATVATALPADAPTPVVKSVQIDPAAKLVYLEVENTADYLAYDVAAGARPDALEKGKAVKPVQGAAGRKITIVAPMKGQSGFYGVGRK